MPKELSYLREYYPHHDESPFSTFHQHFSFAVAGSEELRESGLGLAVRYTLEGALAGTIFEPLQVDVSLAPPEFGDGQPAQHPRQ